MKKSWLAGLSKDLKRRFLDFIGRGERWDVWEDAQTGFESLDLMTEGIEKEQLLRSVRETEMGDLGIVGILGLRILSDKKKVLRLNLRKD